MSKIKFPKNRIELSKLTANSYHISEALLAAVEVALMTGRPLLLTGNPGTGKSDLAEYLALNLEGAEGKLLRFNVKTTSKASDMLYRYDAIAHYHATRQEVQKTFSTQEIKDQFISWEALGEAIVEANGKCPKEDTPKDPVRRVVLIDEIDKAPRDLPNDLLDIVDNMRFDIPELRNKENDLSRIGYDRSESNNTQPIVILTSNSDKSLPEPFLRRCVFYHIPDPDATELEKILLKRLGDKAGTADEHKAYIAHFEWLKKNKTNNKEPRTAELLQWLLYCKEKAITPAMLKEFEEKENKADNDTLKKIWASYSLLIKDKSDWEDLKH